MTMPTERAATTSDIALAQDMDTLILKRVTWGAIFAGIVSALVAQLLLNMLGVGIGLSTLDPGTADNPDATTFSVAAAVWWTVSGIISSFLGGLVAGRLCGRPSRSTASWHGVVQWAATTLIIFWTITTSLGALMGGAFSVVGNMASAAGSTAAAGMGAATAGAAQGAAGPFAGLEQDIKQATGVNDPGALRDSIVSYLRSTAMGNQGDAQAARQRAVDALARAGNIPPDQADARLRQWEQQYQQAAEQAKQQATQAAETAKKVVSQASIYGFIALVLGGIAAWFGGRMGTPEREVVTTAAARGGYAP